MKKAIVTTTINEPTKALDLFKNIAIQDDWRLFIVGDKKTPHESYKKWIGDWTDRIFYISPTDQEVMSKELSDAIGWNCIQRRNFGYLAAYKWGADVIATIDDDNIPTDDWGKNLKVNQEQPVLTFKIDEPIFDPLSPAFPNLWHRGFPIQLLKNRKLNKPQLKKRTILVQADMWDGDPDVDAIGRIAYSPDVKFNPNMTFYASNKPGPFNSQNTFLSRKVMKDFFLFPHIGRMDDIWASYFLQAKHPDSVAYYKATVFQDRNEHDLVKDLKAEMIGYEHTLEFTKWLYGPDFTNKYWPEYMPKKAIEAYEIYRDLMS